MSVIMFGHKMCELVLNSENIMYSRRFCINITQHDSYDCEKGVTNIVSIGGCFQ